MVHFFYMNPKRTPDLSPLYAPLRVLLACGLAGGLFVAGYVYGRGPGMLEGSAAGLSLGENADVPPELANDLDFATFWKVWSLIREKYVDQPVSDQDLYYGALQGLLYGLKDPYSTYFTPKMAEEFDQEMAGTFFGIGAEIGLNEDGQIVIIAPLPDTPASNAGVMAGDRILTIDGEDTTGMYVSTAVSKIRGEKDTSVSLQLIAPGAAEPRTVSITRGEIELKSVKWEVRPDNIGVIEVNIFNEDTESLFAQAAEEMRKANVKGIVLDLRNNPGGYLDGATNLAGYWIGSQTAVLEEVRGQQVSLPASGDARFAKTPTVVLVNGGSASASEILAGALQDYGNATVIGEQTFGKGSVQEYQYLDDGSAVKITVARWLTPKGRSIDGEGIAPDQTVTFSVDDYHANKDPQLDAAFSFLAQK